MCFLYILQRYACFKKARKVHPPAGLEKTRYYANFANFISRATFWWVGDVLWEGFKAPLTAEQLGKLPTVRAIIVTCILLKYKTNLPTCIFTICDNLYMAFLKCPQTSEQK